MVESTDAERDERSWSSMSTLRSYRKSSVDTLTLHSSAVGACTRGREVLERALRVSLHRSSTLLPVCGADLTVLVLGNEPVSLLEDYG